MNARSLNLTSAALALGPVVIAVACWLLISAIWNGTSPKVPEPFRYWFLRSQPAFYLGFSPLILLLAILLIPSHRRLVFSRVAVAMFLGTVAYYSLVEYGRLSPFSAQYGWSFVIRFVDLFVAGGAAVGLAASGIGIRLAQPAASKIKRAKKGPLGDADWMKMEIAGKIFPAGGGIVIGERYRVDRDIVASVPFRPQDAATWGQGGRAPLLTFNCEFGSTHGLLFAGSGGFKTTGSVIPTALRWSGPLVCLDPSTEIAPLVRDYRTRELGRQIQIIDPALGLGFDVLDWVKTSLTKEQDIATVARWLLSESPKVATGSDTYFQDQAHNLLTGLLAHVVLSPDYEGERNLRGLRRLISTPEPALKAMMKGIYENADSEFIRESVGVFINMTENTFSSVYSTASKDTQWLSFPEYADLVCGESFTSEQLVRGEIDVFINLKLEILSTYKGIARVIVGGLMNAMFQANGRHSERVLVLLDEVNLLGTMQTLEVARDLGRKYGVTLLMVYQSVGQIKRHFGNEGKAAWFESASYIIFAAINDMEAAEEISRRCGDMTIEVTSSSKSAAVAGSKGGGRATKSTNEQRRALIMPHEVIQNMRTDEQIVFTAANPPLRCGRAIYFRREDMRPLVAVNRFARQARA